jgi:hypothetical protein
MPENTMMPGSAEDAPWVPAQVRASLLNRDVNPSMIMVSLVSGDRWVRVACPNCHKVFRPHEQVFESVDQCVAIHVHCVVALALLASAQGPKPPRADAIAAEYREIREALLTEQERDLDGVS